LVGVGDEHQHDPRPVVAHSLSLRERASAWKTPFRGAKGDYERRRPIQAAPARHPLSFAPRKGIRTEDCLSRSERLLASRARAPASRNGNLLLNHAKKRQGPAARLAPPGSCRLTVTKRPCVIRGPAPSWPWDGINSVLHNKMPSRSEWARPKITQLH
jgi:hypothetical protein